jgi:predicted ABC-type transport system involved in lysophospholipase L1 biosynthesis ATPase subunit
LADEPTGNLDRDSSLTVADVLRRLPDEHGCTVVLVTHDLDLAGHADRRLLLDDGRLSPAVAHSLTSPRKPGP